MDHLGKALGEVGPKDKGGKDGEEKEVFATATAPAKEVKAAACRAWKVRIVNALGAGVEDTAVSAEAVVEAVFEAAVESPLPVSL